MTREERLDKLGIWMKLNGVVGEVYWSDETMRASPYRWRHRRGPNTDQNHVRFFPTFEALEMQIMLAIEFKKESDWNFWRMFGVL